MTTLDSSYFILVRTGNHSYFQLFWGDLLYWFWQILYSCRFSFVQSFYRRGFYFSKGFYRCYLSFRLRFICKFDLSFYVSLRVCIWFWWRLDDYFLGCVVFSNEIVFIFTIIILLDDVIWLRSESLKFIGVKNSIIWFVLILFD